ncbi:MAG: hypothetical protein NZ741_05185, partial [Armatimonadetes bacterium]|nr:hypothetical protein [Armatimonadota bacterium]
GSPVVKLLTIALLVGVTTGTYSSIFTATPIVAYWEEVAQRRGLRPAEPRISAPTQPAETAVRRDGAPDAEVAATTPASSSKPRPKRRRRA